jgi:rare lipoprotein A
MGSPDAQPAPPIPPTAAFRADSMRSTSAAGQVPTARARFRIQITAVRTATAADDIARKLKAKGLDARVIQEGGLHKVRVGSYATRADAAADVPNVKAQLGGSPFVVAEP